MRQLPPERCPVYLKLQRGEIVDRRPTDFDPTFPTEFSYA